MIYAAATVAAIGAITYGLATGDPRPLLLGFLALLLFLGLIHEVAVRRQNLASIDDMRQERSRDWEWPDRDAA